MIRKSIRILTIIALGALLTNTAFLTKVGAKPPSDPDKQGLCYTAFLTTTLFSAASALPSLVDPQTLAKLEEGLAKFRKRLAGTDLEATIKDVAVLAGRLREMGETGVARLTGRVVQADRRIDRFLVAECGFKTVPIVGGESFFRGMPKSLRTGNYAFHFRNTGREVHEMTVVRILSDLPLDQVLALPPPDAANAAVTVAAVFAPPSASNTAFANLLEPGRYALVDPLSQGLTSLQQVPTAMGQSHAARGMVAEFQVKKHR